MFFPKKKWKTFFVLMLFTTTLFFLNLSVTTATAGLLSQEYSLEWSDTSISDLCTGDVDGDGVIEIIMVGYQKSSERKGEISILSWDGSAFIEEWNELFTMDEKRTYCNEVDIGDLNGDGVLEIVVVGYSTEESNGYFHYTWLNIYRWDGTTLDLLDSWMSEAGEIIGCVKVGDFNGDGYNEIVTAGEGVDVAEYKCSVSLIRVWSWSSGLYLKDSVYWSQSDSEYPHSDVEGLALGLLDGELMIATVSNFWSSEEKWESELTLWSYDSHLTLEESEQWEAISHSWVSGVHVDNNKIFTVGTSEDGTRSMSQLMIWGWGSLTLENAAVWYTHGNTGLRDVYVEDVDGDGSKEIVTVGRFNDGSRFNAQLRVWNYDSDLSLQDSREWYVTNKTGISTVLVKDIDTDNIMEIITGGYADNWRGQVTIWSYPDITEPTISGQTPSDGAEVSTGKPTIKVPLSDDYSGVDVDSVSITVGGSDVTSSATVTATSVSYTPSSDLPDGSVTVTVEVSDKSGNTASASWTFTVKALAPPGPGIPGFPLEGIIVGIAVAAVTVYLLRKRTMQGIPVTPSI